MKKKIFTLIYVLTVITFTGYASPQSPESDDPLSRYELHPQFPLLDQNRKPAGDTGKISVTETCAPCHDTRFINGHNDHFNDRVKADCLVCHLEGGEISGNPAELYTRIQLPDDKNCARCHGLIHFDDAPLAVPPDYLHTVDYEPGRKDYGLTQNKGEVLSPQNLANSHLNIRNKQELAVPWDTHARRGLTCISCHFTRNDPRSCGTVQYALDHLKRDPRKIKPPKEYLKRPDHNLVSAQCRCCHDPFVVHPHLPYKQRHMDVLECQSCHAPRLYGPAFRVVDRTVMTQNGGPRIEFRDIDTGKSHGENPNTQYITGYRPYLFAGMVYSPEENRDKLKISPFNLVTHWYWRSATTGEPVDQEILKKVFFDRDHFVPDILEVFDSNQDNRLDSDELVLDSSRKIELIKKKLAAQGVGQPVISGEIKSHRIVHTVVPTKLMTLNCQDCHSRNSKIDGDVILAGHSPLAGTPEFSRQNTSIMNGKVVAGDRGELRLKRTADIAGRYIFGSSRIKGIDLVGFWIFLLGGLAVLGHAAFRYAASKKIVRPEVKGERVYMFSLYERLWHWTMALSILLLVLTGMEIHYAGSFTIFGLAAAVPLHNILAAIVVVNAAFSLFYHITTGEIRQFFKLSRRFLPEATVQAYYYIRGIFRGEPHPIPRSRERKLNPLQQLTYIILLNILLPYQIITGILIWGAERWVRFSDAIGGLTIVAPLHNLGSWLFLTFVVVHIYLTTTGHTVFANLKAMIGGYDEVTTEEPSEKQRRLMEMKLLELLRTLLGNRRKKSKRSQS